MRRTLLLLFVAASATAHAGSRADAEKQLAKAAAAHNLTIDIAGSSTKIDPGISCPAMTSSHVTIALPILLPELNRYGADFFTDAKIKRMVLCGDLEERSKEWGGLAVYASNTFYVNLKSANVDAGHAQRTFHHEVFHLIDEVDDAEWQKIGGSNAFITDYARTGPKEDRAEMFAEMMVNGRNVASRASGNRALKQKAQLMESWVKANHPDVYKEMQKGQ